MDLEKLQLGKLTEIVQANLAESERLELQLKWGFTKDKKVLARILDKDLEVYLKEYEVKYLHIALAEMQLGFKWALEQIEYDRRVKSNLKARFNPPLDAFKGGKPEWKQGRGKNKGEDDGNDWANRKKS